MTCRKPTATYARARSAIWLGRARQDRAGHARVALVIPRHQTLSLRRVVGDGYRAETHGPLDLVRIATDLVTPAAQHRILGGRLVGCQVRGVPGIREPGDRPQRLALTGSTDEDGQPRLERWRIDCAPRPRGIAPRGHALAQHAVDEFGRSSSQSSRSPTLAEVDAEGRVLRRTRPRRSQHGAAARQVVERRHLLHHEPGLRKVLAPTSSPGWSGRPGSSPRASCSPRMGPSATDDGIQVIPGPQES